MKGHYLHVVGAFVVFAASCAVEAVSGDSEIAAESPAGERSGEETGPCLRAKASARELIELSGEYSHAPGLADQVNAVRKLESQSCVLVEAALKNSSCMPQRCQAILQGEEAEEAEGPRTAKHELELMLCNVNLGGCMVNL